MDEFDHTRRKLIERILHLTEKQPVVRPLPGLTVGRRESPTEPSTYILPPSICIAVQGAKRVLIGEEYYIYDVENFLLNSFDIPVIAQVIEASKEKPYIGITWEIDMEILMEIVVEQKLNTRPTASSRGTSLGKVTYQLLDAFKRMLDLLDEPEHISALLPVIKKEIIYRLLVSEQGSKLIQIALSGKNDVIAALNIELSERTLQRTREHEKACRDRRNERVDFLSEFQDSHRHHSSSVPEKASIVRGKEASHGRKRCHNRSLPGGIREPLSVQQRVQKILRCFSFTGCKESEGRTSHEDPLLIADDGASVL
ncbi:AraC-like transcriptional regulator [Thermotoga sp. Mc24]|nr:AraC-like transcriptional regulator [Thermotoga sp. Mc24]